MPDKAIEVLDSQLEYISGPKFRLRIFYDPRTGKELAIDGRYFDLIDDPKVHDFYSDDLMSRLWIMYNDKVVGLIGQVRLQEQLSHIKFKAEQD